LILNYIDYKDVFFFAKETNKIYEDYNSIKYLQRLIQYPTFLFYIAPLTTLLSVKVAWDFSICVIKRRDEYSRFVLYFAMFNILELLLMMLQGMAGTGGTNMISRYIVINALLFVPFAVFQLFKFRKILSVIFLVTIIMVNFIWCYYFPQSFRADTIETGTLLKTQIEKAQTKTRRFISKKSKGIMMYSQYRLFQIILRNLYWEFSVNANGRKKIKEKEKPAFRRGVEYTRHKKFF